MSGGTQNIPLIRLENRVDDVRRSLKVNTVSRTISVGFNHPSLNVIASGAIGLNVASPNSGLFVTIQNNQIIGWQNSAGFHVRTTAVDAGSRIYKGSDDNLFIDFLDGNVSFRRGGQGASLRTTILIDRDTGYVGFNNSTPESVIHIGAGDILLERNRHIYFKNTTSVSKSTLTVNTASSLLVTAPNQLILRAGSDSTAIEGMRIHTDGTVGISGTKTPVTPLTDLHVEGDQYNKGNRYYFTSFADYAATGSISGADLVAGWIRATGGTATTLTFPTGTAIDAALPSNAPNGITFQVMITNSTAVNHTLATATGLTFNPALAATFSTLTNRLYVFVKTGTATYNVYLV